MSIDNNKYKLDRARESLIDNWDCSSFFVWHRQYKEYEEVRCPYAKDFVIVAQYKGLNSLHACNKVGYIPFVYQGVPIVVWK